MKLFCVIIAKKGGQNIYARSKQKTGGGHAAKTVPEAGVVFFSKSKQHITKLKEQENKQQITRTRTGGSNTPRRAWRLVSDIRNFLIMLLSAGLLCHVMSSIPGRGGDALYVNS